MVHEFDGVRVLLTGASRGLGLAAAHCLVGAGACVLGVARDSFRLERATVELSKQDPGSFDSLPFDLAAQETPAIIAKRVGEQWGALDIVIHNAGVMLHRAHGPMDELDGILEASLEVNLLAPFRISRALIPLLRSGNEPRIINVGSGAGTIDGLAEPGIASYRLSKWAVNGMTMLQARELACVISVNAFDPGWVRTDLGGPEAPYTADEAADGLMKTLRLPWEWTGQFFKDGEPIPW